MDVHNRPSSIVPAHRSTCSAMHMPSVCATRAGQAPSAVHSTDLRVAVVGACATPVLPHASGRPRKRAWSSRHRISQGSSQQRASGMRSTARNVLSGADVGNANARMIGRASGKRNADRRPGRRQWTYPTLIYVDPGTAIAARQVRCPARLQPRRRPWVVNNVIGTLQTGSAGDVRLERAIRAAKTRRAICAQVLIPSRRVTSCPRCTDLSVRIRRTRVEICTNETPGRSLQWPDRRQRVRSEQNVPRLLDARFKYVPAASTDITLTWRRFGYRPTTDAERQARQRALGTFDHARRRSIRALNARARSRSSSADVPGR